MNRQPVTLRQHDSINLTTGVVTRSAVATANQRTVTINVPSGVIRELHRNNLRALSVILIEDAQEHGRYF